jgi:hypothetical protein
MKQYKNMFTIALVTAASFFTSAVKAGDEPKTVPVELRYVGTIQNQPLIQLDFTGTKAENEFAISITDQNGIVLYSDNVKGEKFSRQFLLDTEDLGDAVLNFAITGLKSGKTVTYKVSRKTTTIQEMDVAKL